MEKPGFNSIHKRPHKALNQTDYPEEKTTSGLSSHRHDSHLKSLTVHWNELPDWAQDNEYIIAGYRRVQNHWRGCVYSVFGYLHNETINIHSHLFGALLFIYLLVVYTAKYLGYYPSDWRDYLVFTAFFISAIFCLSASATYHAGSCHSEEVSTKLHSLDYLGIIVLTVGSFYPAVYYGFFCHPQYQALYMTAITVFGIGSAYIVLHPEYAKPSHRGARTAVFIALGLSAVFPVLHGLILHGVSKLMADLGFRHLVLSGTFYIGGALLYANRIPERFYPGGFDYFFASHQIFHCFVVLAAISHLMCIHKALEFSYITPQLCP